MCVVILEIDFSVDVLIEMGGEPNIQVLYRLPC